MTGPGARGLVALEPGGRRAALDRGDRGGADAARPGRLVARQPGRRRARRAPGGRRRPRRAGDARVRARAAHRAARDGRGGRGTSSAACATRIDRTLREELGLRAAVAGMHPFAVARGRRHHLGPPLPRGRGDDARARPARADDGAARARRGPGRRHRRARARRPARRAAGDARAVGQLALLARQRLGLRVGAHAGLLDVPAHRHPAPLRPLRRVRATVAAMLRSRAIPDPASSGGTRGCSRGSGRSRCASWTPSRGCSTSRRWPRSCSAWSAATPRAGAPTRRRWSCSPRTASSPPATGSRRSCSTTAATTAGAPCARRSPSCWRTARRTRASSAARSELADARRSPPTRATRASARCAERRGPRALLARLADEYAHPARAMLAAWTPAGEAGL